MQTNELKEQLAEPSQRLFMDETADVDLAREVGQAVGGHAFTTDDPTKLVQGIINMEAYFHHLREKSLEALKQLLAQRYNALAAVVIDNGVTKVELKDNTAQELPGHTSPALNEFAAQLGPAEGGDNPRLALELIQQTARLMEVMGLDRLSIGNGNTAKHNAA